MLLHKLSSLSFKCRLNKIIYEKSDTWIHYNSLLNSFDHLDKKKWIAGSIIIGKKQQQQNKKAGLKYSPWTLLVFYQHKVNYFKTSPTLLYKENSK